MRAASAASVAIAVTLLIHSFKLDNTTARPASERMRRGFGGMGRQMRGDNLLQLVRPNCVPLVLAIDGIAALVSEPFQLCGKIF